MSSDVLCGNAITTVDAVTGQRISVNCHAYANADPGNNARFATQVPADGADDGYAFFVTAKGPGTLNLTKRGYAPLTLSVNLPCVPPGQFALNIAMSPQDEPYPPTSDKLIGSLTIKGPYPRGPRPGSHDNALFVDEIDTLDESTQDAAIAQLVREKADHISLGPIVAKGYHGDYDDTNWVGNPEGILRIMRKARRAGLRIVFTALPDVEPYFHTDERNGGTWDWNLIERDFGPIYRLPEFEALVEEVQHGWENICANAEFVRAFAWLKSVFPTQRRWWHSWPDHSAPGLSSEPISEAEMVRRCKDAGMTGIFWQSAARSRGDNERNDAGRLPLEQFQYDVMDFIRHCRDGYGSPPWPGGVDCRPREYMSYWIYHYNYPVTGTPSDWGNAALDLGSTGAMDGGPR